MHFLVFTYGKNYNNNSILDMIHIIDNYKSNFHIKLAEKKEDTFKRINKIIDVSEKNMQDAIEKLFIGGNLRIQNEVFYNYCNFIENSIFAKNQILVEGKKEIYIFLHKKIEQINSICAEEKIKNQKNFLSIFNSNFLKSEIDFQEIISENYSKINSDKKLCIDNVSQKIGHNFNDFMHKYKEIFELHIKKIFTEITLKNNFEYKNVEISIKKYSDKLCKTVHNYLKEAIKPDHKILIENICKDILAEAKKIITTELTSTENKFHAIINSFNNDIIILCEEEEEKQEDALYEYIKIHNASIIVSVV